MYPYPPRYDVGGEAAHAPVDSPHPKVAERDVEQVRHQDRHGLVAGRPYHQVLAMPRCYPCSKTKQDQAEQLNMSHVQVSGSKKGSKRASKHTARPAADSPIFHITCYTCCLMYQVSRTRTSRYVLQSHRTCMYP